MPMKPVDKVFWIRAALGASVGLLSGIMEFLGSAAYKGIILAIAVYLVSYYIAKYVIEVEIPGGQSHKLLTSGLGSYIMLFLFTWILYNTLFHFAS